MVGLALGSVAQAQQTPANGEFAVAGTVAGSFLDTWSGDGVCEAIQEVESGGKPSSRTSLLEHKWTFDVPAGTSVTLHVRAHHDANAEGDDFVFAWSADDVTYVDLLTVTKTVDDGSYQTADLDPGISGPVYVRARDTNRTKGRTQLDALYVDHLYIESSQVATPPAAPSDLAAGIAQAAGYDGLLLGWADNSGNEDGFRIERSLDGTTWDPLATVGPDVTSYIDSGLLPETTYSYVVQAFNGQGDSGWSNVASATTLPPVAFTTEVVDPAGWGVYMGLAIDPLGRPAIGYATAGVVWFAQWNGVDWDIEAVDESETGVGVAFLPDGTPCLSYGWGEMRFAQKIGDSWSIEVVELRNWNDWNSLVIDPDGNPAIAYMDNGSRIGKVSLPGGLRLATRIAGTWVIEVVDTEERPSQKSLAYDPLGRPSIAYNRYVDGRHYLKFARWSGTAWEVEVVEGDGVDSYGLDVSLAYDTLTGEPAILHHMVSHSGGLGEVRLLRWNGVAWQVELVIPDASWPAGLTFTSAGVPYFAYLMNGHLENSWVGRFVAHRDGVSWVSEFVNAWEGYGRSALALDADERPSIAHGGSAGLQFAQQ